VKVEIARFVFWNALVLAVLSGCNPNKQQGAENHAGIAMNASSTIDSASAASTPELVLAPFKMTDPMGRTMEVTADGVATLPLGVWGKISSDGMVVDGKGALRARVSGGRVFDSSGAEFARLSADGTATAEGHTSRFDGEGRFDLGTGKAMLISPADSPARRTATLVLLIVLLRPAAGDIKLTPSMQFNVPITEDKPK
jgi:hypothetical protein